MLSEKFAKRTELIRRLRIEVVDPSRGGAVPETLEQRFKQAVLTVVQNDLKALLRWDMVLPESLPADQRTAYIFLGFDVAGVVSISGPDISGYIGVGFTEEVAIKLTVTLLGSFNPKELDIYIPQDPLTEPKDPYGELNLAAASRINDEVEEAVRKAADFVAQSMKAHLAQAGVEFEIGFPMVVVGRNMTSFASFPLIGVTTPFMVREGHGCVEFAIAEPSYQKPPS